MGIVTKQVYRNKYIQLFHINYYNTLILSGNLFIYLFTVYYGMAETFFRNYLSVCFYVYEQSCCCYVCC